MVRLNLKEPRTKYMPMLFNKHVLFYRASVDRGRNIVAENVLNIIVPKAGNSSPILYFALDMVEQNKKEIFEETYRDELGKPIELFFDGWAYTGIIEEMTCTAINDGFKTIPNEDQFISMSILTEPHYSYNLDFTFITLTEEENEDYLRSIFDLGGEIIE